MSVIVFDTMVVMVIVYLLNQRFELTEMFLKISLKYRLLVYKLQLS